MVIQIFGGVLTNITLNSGDGKPLSEDAAIIYRGLIEVKTAKTPSFPPSRE